MTIDGTVNLENMTYLTDFVVNKNGEDSEPEYFSNPKRHPFRDDYKLSSHLTKYEREHSLTQMT